MPSLNWGMIRDGGAFESLAHALLYAEDPGTLLFGRPGRDAGQDVRSGDGTVVYQAKFHTAPGMQAAIADALKELEKIREYRKPTHHNCRHWQSASRWVMVTNLLINPNDDSRWQEQVIPVFREQGLAAGYWSVETLEGKLAEHPEIADVFFDGENRVLVGLKEAYDLLKAECVGSSSFDIQMVGRDDELERIRTFASSDEARILPIVGPAGVGKSRLLYEALLSLSQDGWRVFWGLSESMARSSQWFRLLNGTHKTCVALDAPEDPGLLRAVVEQLATVERREWRVLIACRTEKAAVLDRFRAHRHFGAPLKLGPPRRAIITRLGQRCSGGRQTVWMAALRCTALRMVSRVGYALSPSWQRKARSETSRRASTMLESCMSHPASKPCLIPAANRPALCFAGSRSGEP